MSYLAQANARNRILNGPPSQKSVGLFFFGFALSD